jgi:IS605 OrfB family transposase
LYHTEGARKLASTGTTTNTMCDTRTYPHAGRRYAFKTIRCKLDQEDVAAGRPGLDALFLQYHAAVRSFLRLMPIRAPYRDAFRKEDMAAAKAVAPGLEPGLRSSALDKAIEMWRSFEAKGGLSYGSRTGIPGSKASKNGSMTSPDHIAVRLSRKDLMLVAGSDAQGGPIKVSIPAPLHAVELRILGEGHQVPILRKVLKGEGGLIRCVSELSWKDPGGTKDKDLILDVHIGKPIEKYVQRFPDISGPAEMFVPIGVDIGVRNILVAVAPGKGGKGVLFVKGGRWREKHRRFVRSRSLRRALGDDKGWAASRQNEGNYVRDMAHKASKELLDLAARIADRKKGELPVIVLEDLDFGDCGQRQGTPGGIDNTGPIRREQSEELDAWPRTLLRDIIIEKAAWEGVPVMVVSPDGTSTACPRCGSPDAVRRRDVHRLVCPDCAYKADDDFCAALNIARRGLAMVLGDRARPVRYHDHGLRGVMCPAEGGAADAPRGPDRERFGASTQA